VIESIVNALKGIAAKPAVLLPALATPIAVLLLVFVFQEALFNLLTEAIFFGELPETTVTQFPVHLAAMYGAELFVVALIAFVASIVSIGVVFVQARLAAGIMDGKTSIRESLGNLLGNTGSVVALGVFVFVIALLAMLLLWITVIIAGFNGFLGMLLGALVVLLAAYLAIKLAFTVQAMALEGAKLKEALLKSWEFTNNRFWGVVVFLIAVAIIYSIVISVGDAISAAVPEENISGIVFVIFWLVAASFTNLAIANYYLKNALAK